MTELKWTECCGKPVRSHKEDKQMGYYMSGPIPATGDTYCDRCRCDVTRIGGMKKTPRKADIEKNGSWEYRLKEIQK